MLRGGTAGPMFNQNTSAYDPGLFYQDPPPGATHAVTFDLGPGRGGVDSRNAAHRGGS